MSQLYKNKYRIPSTRLPGYDYGQPGYYFITICTKNRFGYFGNVINEKMSLNNIGQIVENELHKTETMRNNVMIDKLVVMPNHIHAIIAIGKIIEINNEKIFNVNFSVETHCNASLPNDNKIYKNKFGPQKNNLASIIRGFKSTTTKIINEKYGYNYFAWQPRFYDHIVRNEKSLSKIRQYIINNPKMWWRDRNNSEGLLM